MWSHGSGLLNRFPSPRRSLLCWCLLGVVVFWTGCKRLSSFTIGHALRCRASRLPRAQLNDGRLATQQTPTLHLIIIIIAGILHVTNILAYSPCDKYLPIYGEKSSRVGAHALRPGLRPGTTREACFSVTLKCLLYPHPGNQRARATSLHFIRHGTVANSSPTTAGVEFKDDCIAVSTCRLDVVISSVHSPGNMQACSHICTFRQNESFNKPNAAAVKSGRAGMLTSIDLCAQASRLRPSQRDSGTIAWRYYLCMARSYSSSAYTCTVLFGDRTYFCP